MYNASVRSSARRWTSAQWMLAASVDPTCRSAARTAPSKAAPLAYTSTALGCQLSTASGARPRAGERVASRIMPRRTRAPRTTHNQTRLPPSPLPELDELLGVGLGVVAAVLGAVVGLAVLGAAVGLATVGVTEGSAVGDAGAPALGEEAVTAPRALCAPAVTRHPASTTTVTSSMPCMKRRIPDPSMA